jgi:DNA-binding transcriptional LysR family regulator
MAEYVIALSRNCRAPEAQLLSDYCAFLHKACAMKSFSEWTDVRYFLELARSGTLSAAARGLNVEHTTVSRRLQRLEAELGAPLFDRRRDGCELTDVGRALLPHAEAMESAMLNASEVLHGEQTAARGAVRFNAPELIGSLIITPRLAGLLEQHPELHVDLVLLPRFADLNAREADLAIVLDQPKSGRYVTARLTDYHYYLYASPEYLARYPQITSREQLAEHCFLDYVQDQLASPHLSFFGELGIAPNRRFCCTGMMAQVAGAIAGMGLVMAPPYAVPSDGRLVRVLPDQVYAKRTFWLVAPTDLFRLRRIRVVWDYLREIVANEPELFIAASP